jgi:hypothetical protein
MKVALRQRLLPAVCLLLVCAPTPSARARGGPGDSPAASPARAECRPNGRTLCFGPFAVSAEWQNPVDGSWRRALALPRVDGVGYFGFFSRANVELMVDFATDLELDSFVYAQATTFKYSIRVEDKRSGAVRLFHEVPDFAHREGCRAFCDGVVTFPDDIGRRGTCVPDDRTLCLANRTLRIRGTFPNSPSGGALPDMGARQVSGLSGSLYFHFPDGSSGDPFVLVKVVPVGEGKVALHYGSALPVFLRAAIHLSVVDESGTELYDLSCSLPRSCEE